MCRSLRIFGICLTILALYPVGAVAQTAVPTTVEPGRVLPDVNQQTQIPKSAPPVELVTTPDAQAPANAEKVTFVLNDLQVIGNSHVANSDISQLWKPYIGQQISLTKIYDIANGITRVYRERGYLLSRAIVPEQDITDGVVEIQILEGFVSNYSIRGENVAAKQQIETYAKEIVSSGTLKSATLERYLLLMNDIPGTNVRAILSPSATVPGSADLTLVPTRTPVNGYVSVDNYGNSYLGPARVSGSAQYNNLFGMPDYASITGLWAPHHNELGYLGTSYRHVVGSEGTRVGLDASYTRTEPSLPSPLDLLDTKGDAYLLRAVGEHPFIRERNLNLTGTTSFDVTNNRTRFGPGFDAIETHDDLRILRAGAAGSYLDTIGGYNTMSLQGSQGFEILGSTRKNDSQKSRAAGDPKFTKVAGEVTRQQRVYGSFTALAGVTGQYAFDPLLSSEEFALGGTEYGRGYDSSQITGDHGVAGKVELAYSGSGEGTQYIEGYQPYVFYDIGRVWRRVPGAGQNDSGSLASAGVGARVSFINNILGNVFVAKPLTEPVTSRGFSDENDIRIQGSLTKNF